MPLTFSLSPPSLDRPRLMRWLRLGSAILSVGYLLGLVAAVLVMRYIGERGWASTALLYLPRYPFALPLPAVMLALGVFGPRRLLWGLPLAAGLLLFPLLGLETGVDRLWSSGGAAAGPRITLLSYNVATARNPEQVAAVIRDVGADLVVLQEYDEGIEQHLGETWKGFHRHSVGQFSLASRYPISEVFLPPRIPVEGSRQPRSARFVHYRVDTPLGPVRLINVHPVSPRNGFEEARGDGLLHELARGRIGRSEGVAVLRANSHLRRLQAHAIAAEAARSPHPVIIAGDTNMPGLSFIFATTFGHLVDGFTAVGRGFGYTYPARAPWMRIDRILVDQRLGFRRFETVGGDASDHRAVVAVIAGK